MLKKFFFLLSLFLALPVFSQEFVILEGRIFADSLDGSSINIVNLTQETGTINNRLGEFRIEVAENDILYFSSVQFEVKEIEVTREIFKTAYLEVELVPKITELEEVEVRNISLSGNLKQDISDIEIFDQASAGIPYPSREKRTPIERSIYRISSSPISLLIYSLNGEMEKLKKARANQKLDILVHKGMDALPLSIFIDEFGIPEEHVINFVYFCAEDPDFKNFVYRDNPLELLEYYQGKVTYYLENRMGL